MVEIPRPFDLAQSRLQTKRGFVMPAKAGIHLRFLWKAKENLDSGPGSGRGRLCAGMTKGRVDFQSTNSEFKLARAEITVLVSFATSTPNASQFCKSAKLFLMAPLPACRKFSISLSGSTFAIAICRTGRMMKTNEGRVALMTYEKSWSDWWRQFLGVSPGGYRDVIKILSSRYVEEMQHVRRYTAHAEHMQYPQFREKLLRIAADEARHAEWLAEKITLFGGTIPNVPKQPPTSRNSWQYLLADLEEEKHCSDDLIEIMQTVRNELPDIAAMLERIYEDGERHRSEIRDMAARSDPQSVWPA
jgi:bacterioferritin (cytochrome b1)